MPGGPLPQNPAAMLGYGLGMGPILALPLPCWLLCDLDLVASPLWASLSLSKNKQSQRGNYFAKFKGHRLCGILSLSSVILRPLVPREGPPGWRKAQGKD